MALFAGCGVCPGCRRVLPTARACDADGKTPLDPRVPAQRDALAEAIWGNAAARRAMLVEQARGRPQRAAVAGLTSALGLGIGVLGELAPTTIALLVSGAAMIGALAAGRGRRILIPSGATAAPSPPRFAAGVVEAADELVAPGSGTPSAAWALELRHEGTWAARTTLRVGATAGMEVVLDGGERVRIPPGPLWLAGDLPQLGDLEYSLEELLAALDPARVRHDPWPLFPFNVVLEQTLHLGDRVELLGELAPAFVAGASAKLYREAPATELAPVAVPVLRML